jgi:hypothetical protein
MTNENYNNLTKEDLLEMLKAILDNIDGLPNPAKITAPTHYDLYAVVAVVYSILKLDEELP